MHFGVISFASRLYSCLFIRDDQLEVSLIVFYNAGSDVLDGGPLGNFMLSASRLMKRDEMVISKCVDRDIPFVMVLSGGYGQDNFKAVHASISNIIKKFQNKKK